MTFLFFACCDCKIYTDAGDRWAYWELEGRGVVGRGVPVDVEAVLNATGFWNPPDSHHLTRTAMSAARVLSPITSV